MTRVNGRRCNDGVPFSGNAAALSWFAVAWAVVLALGVLCQVQADDARHRPVIRAISPLGIVDGVSVQLVIYGLHLGEITELKFPDLKTAPVYKIKSTERAPTAERVPADKLGDTCLRCEVLLPVDTPAGVTRFILLGSKGRSEPGKVVILEAAKAVSENEPNDGFSQAQNLALGQTVAGGLSGRSKADIFRFLGESGQRVKLEVQAAQFGSLLDPFLLLHDADGQVVTELDDGPNGTDPSLEITLPKSGQYFVTVRDAQDSSSAAHAYLLRTRVRGR